MGVFMKFISLIALTLMAVSFISCGGKDGGGGGSKSLSQLQAGQAYTKNGYYNTQTQALEIDGVTYPPSQAYSMVMNQAIQQAQAQNIQPVLISGVYKFRARISGVGTGAVNTYGQQNYPYNQSYNPYGQQQLQLTSVQFYR